MLPKPVVACVNKIKINRRSNTERIGYIGHKTQTEKNENKNTTIKKKSNTEPTKQSGVNTSTR